MWKIINFNDKVSAIFLYECLVGYKGCTPRNYTSDIASHFLEVDLSEHRVRT